LTPLPVLWADEAREILFDYINHIASHDTGAAFKLFDRIESALKHLGYFPRIGTPGRVEGTFEIVTHPNYIAIYEIHPQYIRVLDFTHARKLYPPQP
jgi:toxin ParE1/3/4